MYKRVDRLVTTYVVLGIICMSLAPITFLIAQTPAAATTAGSPPETLRTPIGTDASEAVSLGLGGLGIGFLWIAVQMSAIKQSARGPEELHEH